MIQLPAGCARARERDYLLQFEESQSCSHSSVVLLIFAMAAKAFVMLVLAKFDC